MSLTLEGLAHVSEVSKEKIKTPVGKFQVGDIISAKVININPKERRIGLSVKQLETDEEHDLVVDYLSTYKGSESSLGGLLKENLKEKTVDQDLAEEPLEIADDRIEETDTEGVPEVARKWQGRTQPSRSPWMKQGRRLVLVLMMP